MKKVLNFIKGIDWTSPKSLAIFGLIIIVGPILWHKTSGFIAGKISEYYAGLPQNVQTMKPIEKEIYYEFETTGRVEAKYSINLIARVDGWLQKSFFQEGDSVKKGQKLFAIEPDEYIYAAKTAQASVHENQAVFKNSQIELNRAKALLKEDFVSQEYYDNAVADRNKNRAALDGSIAQMKKANLNLSYTTIKAPFDGRIGKIQITEGNYVTASSGPLTTIYTTNPMRVTFTVKSSDFIIIKKYYNELNPQNHGMTLKDHLPITVKLKLADGTIYDKEGKIEFIDNQIDETTGTITMRAIFENEGEILVPGDYVNVILKMTKPTKVMLIPQSCTKTDVGTGYYVWKVKDGEKGKTKVAEKVDVIVTRNIENNWVVDEGLSFDDEIVVKGIQNIYQTGQPIKTEPYKEDEQPQKESKAE